MLEYFWEIWTIVSSLVTIASVIVAWTPTKEDDKFWAAKVMPVFNLIALRVGNANPNKVQRK